MVRGDRQHDGKDRCCLRSKEPLKIGMTDFFRNFYAYRPDYMASHSVRLKHYTRLYFTSWELLRKKLTEFDIRPLNELL